MSSARNHVSLTEIKELEVKLTQPDDVIDDWSTPARMQMRRDVLSWSSAPNADLEVKQH